LRKPNHHRDPEIAELQSALARANWALEDGIYPERGNHNVLIGLSQSSPAKRENPRSVLKVPKNQSPQRRFDVFVIHASAVLLEVAACSPRRPRLSSARPRRVLIHDPLPFSTARRVAVRQRSGRRR
jgi:hypothetical protein